MIKNLMLLLLALSVFAKMSIASTVPYQDDGFLDTRGSVDIVPQKSRYNAVAAVGSLQYRQATIGVGLFGNRQDPSLLADMSLASSVALTESQKPALQRYTGSAAVAVEGARQPRILILPIPATAWLFGTALFGFVIMSRRRNLS